jgi:hypothetical protein
MPLMGCSGEILALFGSVYPGFKSAGHHTQTVAALPQYPPGGQLLRAKKRHRSMDAFRINAGFSD